MRHAVARQSVVDWVRARLESKYTIGCQHCNTCTNNRCPPRLATKTMHLPGLHPFASFSNSSSTTKVEARRTRARKHRRTACKAWHHGPSARKWVTCGHHQTPTNLVACLRTWVRHSLQHPSVYIVRMSQVLLQNRLCLMKGKFGLHNRFCKDKMVAQLQVTINLYITNSIL